VSGRARVAAEDDAQGLRILIDDLFLGANAAGCVVLEGEPSAIV
jgi:hypothetical protein